MKLKVYAVMNGFGGCWQRDMIFLSKRRAEEYIKGFSGGCLGIEYVCDEVNVEATPQEIKEYLQTLLPTEQR